MPPRVARSRVAWRATLCNHTCYTSGLRLGVFSGGPALSQWRRCRKGVPDWPIAGDANALDCRILPQTTRATHNEAGAKRSPLDGRVGSHLEFDSGLALIFAAVSASFSFACAASRTWGSGSESAACTSASKARR